MSGTSELILDGSTDVTKSTESFFVDRPPASLMGTNIGADIPLEARIVEDWEPVLDAGVAVTLSATGDLPMVLYGPGEYRLIAGRDLGATEKVLFIQSK